jgi:hypothetical protein
LEEVLRSNDGSEQVRFVVYERGLMIEPLIEVSADSPPFLNSHTLKVLNEYRKEDERAVLRGCVKYSERLNHTILKEAGIMRKMIIRNWRERPEEILREAKPALNIVLERS